MTLHIFSFKKQPKLLLFSFNFFHVKDMFSQRVLQKSHSFENIWNWNTCFCTHFCIKKPPKTTAQSYPKYFYTKIQDFKHTFVWSTWLYTFFRKNYNPRLRFFIINFKLGLFTIYMIPQLSLYKKQDFTRISI